jgi:hypothetical protein
MARPRAEEGTSCDVCGRHVLPGEPVHRFHDPDRGHRRRVVCPLCPRRAIARGWVRPPTILEREDAPAA